MEGAKPAGGMEEEKVDSKGGTDGKDHLRKGATSRADTVRMVCSCKTLR